MYIYYVSLSLSLSIYIRGRTAKKKSRIVSVRTCLICPPAPMNHVKIFKGWPPRDAPSDLIPLGYKTFPPDHIDQMEMINQLD